ECAEDAGSDRGVVAMAVVLPVTEFAAAAAIDPDAAAVVSPVPALGAQVGGRDLADEAHSILGIGVAVAILVADAFADELTRPVPPAVPAAAAPAVIAVAAIAELAAAAAIDPDPVVIEAPAAPLAAQVAGRVLVQQDNASLRVGGAVVVLVADAVALHQ